MSFILKILEKLLDRYIRGSVLVEKPLHRYQFTYRTGMSTETALFKVVHRLEKSLKHKEIALGAFLDIEGAFDNTSFDTMVGAARGRGLEDTCCRWIRSMLESRLVHAFLNGSSTAARVAGGCPQKGVLSPLLLNLVVDELLACINDQGFCAMGYADDIVIIVQGKYTHTVRELMQAALNVVVKWTTKGGLSISPQKTVVVPFTNKRNVEDLGPLTLLGRQLQLLGGVKYLQVFLDSKLNWNQHVQNVIKKAQTMFVVVRRTCGIRWGLRPSMVHWLKTRVIRPSIFYGALVWWSKAMHKTTKIYEIDPHCINGGAP
jgi:hypothetical protein